MKFSNVKARKLRQSFFSNENKLLALNFVKHNRDLSNAVRWRASLLLTKFHKSYRSKLTSKCFLTGRSRGYIKLFGLSRLKFREFARDGKLPFVKKVSW